MVDLLLDHRAVEVVGAEAQRDLRDPGRHHDPIRLDVRDVVEHQPRRRDVLDVQKACGLGDVLQRRIVGMKCQRNKCHEPLRLVLQLPQLH